MPEIDDDRDKGFTEVFALNLGFGRIAIQGMKTPSGKVALARIPGQYAPGKLVSKELLRHLHSIDRMPEGAITLSQSLGSVDEFYGWAHGGKSQSVASPLPWTIAIVAASALAYVIKSRKKPAATDTQDEVVAAHETADGETYADTGREYYERGRAQWSQYLEKGSRGLVDKKASEAGRQEDVRKDAETKETAREYFRES